MAYRHSAKATISFVISGLATAALADAVDAQARAPGWVSLLFAVGFMLLPGWGLVYNLWLLAIDRGADTFRVGEPDAEAWTPYSARFSTAALGLFWMSGVALVTTIGT